MHICVLACNQENGRRFTAWNWVLQWVQCSDPLWARRSPSGNGGTGSPYAAQLSRLYTVLPGIIFLWFKLHFNDRCLCNSAELLSYYFKPWQNKKRKNNQAVVVKTSLGKHCSGHMSSTATEAEIEKRVFKFLESNTHKLSATVSFCPVVAAGSPTSGKFFI